MHTHVLACTLRMGTHTCTRRSKHELQNIMIVLSGSSKVDKLNVPEVGSRWVNVTWQKPKQPNGIMSGYVLVALVTSTRECASLLKFECSDCKEAMDPEQVRTV